jgi:hypothetical protein
MSVGRTYRVGIRERAPNRLVGRPLLSYSVPRLPPHDQDGHGAAAESVGDTLQELPLNAAFRLAKRFAQLM